MKKENLEAVAAMVEERKKQEQERAREVAQKNFENFERAEFFARNPGAVESDWVRLRSAILDAARVAGRGRGLVDDLIQRKKSGGAYGNR